MSTLDTLVADLRETFPDATLVVYETAAHTAVTVLHPDGQVAVLYHDEPCTGDLPRRRLISPTTL